MIKRLADFLEKASVASLAVGVFQNNNLGVILGFILLVCCLGATWLVLNLEKRG